VAFDPNYSRAYAAIAASLHKSVQENWRIGIDFFNKRIKLENSLERSMLEPSSLSPIASASIDIKLGRFETAIEHAERPITLNSNDIGAYVVLGRALIFAGRHQEALPILDTAIRLDPRNPSEIHSLTGLAMFMLEDTAAAVPVLEQARAAQQEIKSNGPTVSLMSAYAHLGRANDARRMEAEIGPIWFKHFLGDTNLASVMTLFPFHKQRDAEWYGSGLLRAGICCEKDLKNVLSSKQE
jgi:adenylate cyclase